jgi:multidrug efflux pump subunit AcrA (membrane-fusion protein)
MKIFRILMVALVMSIAACSSEKDQPEGKFRQSETVEVRTQVVRSERLPILRSFPGTVASADTALLTPKVVGYLDRLNVQGGDTFKKGAVLASIRSQELVDKKNFAESAVREARNGERQAALGRRIAETGFKQALAQFNLAEKTYQRFENLLKTESVSKQEFDEVEAKYRAALEARKMAEENVKLAGEKLTQVRIKKQQAVAMLDEVKTYLGYTELRAPFDGVVLQKLMDVGNLAAPGEAILKIGSLRNVAYAYVDESVINHTKVGDDVTVDVPSANESFKANILEINPNIDPATRSFRVKLSGDTHLTPGMYCNVYFGSGYEDVIVVPRSAVLQRGQLYVVFVDKDKTAEMRIVKTGRVFKDSMEILSGLYPGEKLVLNKVEQLKSGDSLEE